MKKIFLLIITKYFLSGCSIHSSDIDIIEEKLCSGIYEYKFNYVNGDGIIHHDYKIGHDGRYLKSHNDELKDLKDFYRKQSALMNSQPNKISFVCKDKDGRTLDNSSSDFYYLYSNERNNCDINYPGHVKEYKNTKIKKITKEPMQHYELSYDPSAEYVEQHNSQSCWAASLSTAFKHAHLNYSQDAFLNAIDQQCKIELSSMITVNQMMFAASEVHLDSGGVWMGADQIGVQLFMSPFPINRLNNRGLGAHLMIKGANWEAWGSFTPNIPRMLNNDFLNLYGNFGKQHNITLPSYSIPIEKTAKRKAPLMHIGWDTSSKDGKLKSKGYLGILFNTAEIVLAIKSKNPVIVGFKDKDIGHTSVLYSVQFRPGGNYDPRNDTFYIDHRTYISNVKYADPSQGWELISEPGDQFIERLAFAIELNAYGGITRKYPRR